MGGGPARFFARKLTGLTDEVLSELSDKRRKGSVTQGYANLTTMKDFGLSPADWRALTRFEKRCLHYHRIMEQYYMKRARDEHKKDMEREQNRSKFLASLPRQMPHRRRP